MYEETLAQPAMARASERAAYLNVPLLEQRVVSVGSRVADLRAQCVALGPEALVQHDAASPELVVGEDLIAQLIDELVETQVHLRTSSKTVHSIAQTLLLRPEVMLLHIIFVPDSRKLIVASIVKTLQRTINVLPQLRPRRRGIVS